MYVKALIANQIKNENLVLEQVPPLLKLMWVGQDQKNQSQTRLFLARYCYATPWWWTTTVSECCCMFVWAMDGMWQGCSMTIWRWNESLFTLETLVGQARSERLIPAKTLPGKILLCHTLMMDCHCSWVLPYVSLGHFYLTLGVWKAALEIWQSRLEW